MYMSINEHGYEYEDVYEYVYVSIMFMWYKTIFDT